MFNLTEPSPPQVLRTSEHGITPRNVIRKSIHRFLVVIIIVIVVVVVISSVSTIAFNPLLFIHLSPLYSIHYDIHLGMITRVFAFVTFAFVASMTFGFMASVTVTFMTFVASGGVFVTFIFVASGVFVTLRHSRSYWEALEKCEGVARGRPSTGQFTMMGSPHDPVNALYVSGALFVYLSSVLILVILDDGMEVRSEIQADDMNEGGEKWNERKGLNGTRNVREGRILSL
ncbi:hypothetical protein L218DRAFT_948642 [Marasmius fiardii PR-910]|nr:hypothetical protein L218DRAFT_948642 [Marasmius fiardii PR-910]